MATAGHPNDQYTAGDGGRLFLSARIPTSSTPINNFGTLVINYNFFTVPDDMQIYYDGVKIFEHRIDQRHRHVLGGFRSGSFHEHCDCDERAGHESRHQGDLWTYTASVITPSPNLSYATFSENTNLTTTPIKFATPPFGGGAPPSPRRSCCRMASRAWRRETTPQDR